jgi:hypothetical protein
LCQFLSSKLFADGPIIAELCLMTNDFNLDYFLHRSIGDKSAFFLQQMLKGGNSVPGFFKVNSAEAEYLFTSLLKPRPGEYVSDSGETIIHVRFIGAGLAEYDAGDGKFKVPYCISLVE